MWLTENLSLQRLSPMHRCRGASPAGQDLARPILRSGSLYAPHPGWPNTTQTYVVALRCELCSYSLWRRLPLLKTPPAKVVCSIIRSGESVRQTPQIASECAYCHELPPASTPVVLQPVAPVMRNSPSDRAMPPAVDCQSAIRVLKLWSI